MKNLLKFITVICFFAFGNSISYAETSIKIDNIYLRDTTTVQYLTNRLYIVCSSAKDFEGQITVSYNANNKEIVLLQDAPIKVIGGQSSGMFTDFNISASGNIDLNIKLSDESNPIAAISQIKNVNVLVDTDRDGDPNITDHDDDNDSISDEQEVISGTNPLSPDTDRDGVDDAEDAFPLDSKESADNDKDVTGNNADLDDDNDGLSDVEEKQYKTDPFLADTDKDGINDFDEVKAGTNPLDSDSDHDGIPDGSDPFPLDANRKADSDKDGIADEDEIKAGLDSTVSDQDKDSDSDSVSNTDEVNKYSTNPNKADSDSDGIDDAKEISLGLDPNNAEDGAKDSDVDGLTDAQEIALGTDINNAATYNLSDSTYKFVKDVSPWAFSSIALVAGVYLWKKKKQQEKS